MQTKQYTRSILLYSLICLSVVACSADTVKQNNDTKTAVQQSTMQKARTAFLNKNYVTAAKLLQPLADGGNSQAQYSLGYMYYYGHGVRQDINQALLLISQAAHKNYPKAITALDNITRRDGTSAHINQPSATMKTAPASTHSAIINKAIPEKLEIESHVETSNTPTPDSAPLQAIKETPVSAAKNVTTEITDTTWPPSYVMDAPEVTPVTIDTPVTTPVEKPAQATETTIVQKSKKPQNQSNPGAEWIQRLPDENFTIQVISGKNHNAVMYFMKKKNLQPSAYFVNKVNNQNWYSVITGSYTTFTEARTKANELKQAGIANPWVRNVKNIKKLIRNEK